jgi:peptidoglycan/LPS O-acetylase OafA/YrhL
MHAAYAFLAGFDHQAVMLFFVLSGFLVGGPVLRELFETGQFAAGRYMLRRLIRLCIVLWPAFALAAACMTLAVACGAVERGILPARQDLSTAALLCNAAFLQTAACGQWAGNGALWSLFNEFWYYVLFPPLAMAVFGRSDGRVRAIGAVAALTTLALLTAVQFTGAPVGPYMLIWLAGAGAATLPRPFTGRPALAGVLVLIALFVLRLFVRRSFAPAHPWEAAGLDLAVALLFANLLLTLRCAPSLPPPPWPRLHARLASFSFSLYSTHIPILTLAIAWLSGRTGYGWQMRGGGIAVWSAVAGVIALCLGAAWLFAQATEAQTARVRRWLASTVRREVVS